MTRAPLKIISILLAVVSASLFAAPARAQAVDIPFLTWERGKEQFVILGGPTTAANWQVQLVGEGLPPLNFKGRNSETQGFNIYSIFLPNDLPLGAYTIQSDRSTSGLDIIAAVRVNERTFYQIAQIPPDLKLLLVLFAILASAFSVIRSGKYRRIGFETRKAVESRNLLYRFRRKRQVSQGETLMRFLMMRDAEILHKVSTLIWSLLPWLSLVFGIFIALSTQDKHLIPLLPLALILAASAIGAVDATSGLATALGFALVYIAFGNVNNLRTFLLLIAFTAIWYAPALIAALISLTLPKDFSKGRENNSSVLSQTLANFIGSIFSILLQKSPREWTDLDKENAQNKLVELCQKFRKLEVTNIIRNNNPTRTSFAFVYNDPAKQYQSISYDVDNDRLEEIRNESKSILKNLEKKGLTKDEIIAVLAAACDSSVEYENQKKERNE